MKKLSLLIPALLVILSVSACAKNQKNTVDYNELYESFLTSAIETGDFKLSESGGVGFTSGQSGWLYSCFDIDTDGVPELLLGENNDEKFGKVIKRIYTICNDSVSPQDFIGMSQTDPADYEEPVIFDNGLVRRGGANSDGDCIYSYYKISDGALVLTAKYSHLNGEKNVLWQKETDGAITELSEEAALEEIKKLEGENKVDIEALEWKHIVDFLDSSTIKEITLNEDDTVEILINGNVGDAKELSEKASEYVVSVLSTADENVFTGWVSDCFNWNPTGDIQFKIGDFLFDYNSADGTINSNMRKSGIVDPAVMDDFAVALKDVIK